MDHHNKLQPSLLVAALAISGALAFNSSAVAADQAAAAAADGTPATAAAGDDAAAGNDAAGAAAGEDTFITAQQSSQILASKLIGMDVYEQGAGDDAKNVGTVSDLILGRDDHQLKGVVVGVGGFLGIGAKDVGIPWAHVEYSTTGDGKDVATVDLSRQQFEDAPEFRSKEQQEQDAQREQSATDMQQNMAAPAPQPAPGSE